MRDTLSFVAEVFGATIWSVRSVLARAAVSTLARIDYTVTLKRCGAWKYFVVLFCHHLPSGRVTDLSRTVLGFLHDLRPGSLGRVPIEQARSAQYRTS